MGEVLWDFLSAVYYERAQFSKPLLVLLKKYAFLLNTSPTGQILTTLFPEARDSYKKKIADSFCYSLVTEEAQGCKGCLALGMLYQLMFLHQIY